MSTNQGSSRDYLTDFEAVNQGFGHMITPEGRLVPGRDLGRYEYFHQDHLGNIRAVYWDSVGIAKLDQYTDYDPWGLELPSLSGGSNPNRLRFNGKEAVSELGSGLLDFGARGYDATIGRWLTVDPLSMKNSNESPYASLKNNPINVIDPTGKDGIRVVDVINKTITIKAIYFVQTASRDYMNGDKMKSLPGYSPNEVNSMQTNYNKYLNAINKIVSEGEYKGYKVKFNLQFKDGGTVEASQESAKNETENGLPVGNSISMGNDRVYPRFKTKEIDNGDGTTNTSTVGGVTMDRKIILMNSSQDTKMNRIHEIFHTLGFTHPQGTGGQGGIMKYPPAKPNQADINQVANDIFLPVVIVKPNEKQ